MEQEPSPQLEHASLTRCLNLVARMNESDCKVTTNIKSPLISLQKVKSTQMDRHQDLI